MQVFTTPLMNQDTGFFEIIERRGARGFGLANIRTLFDAVEREQRLTQGVRGSEMATDFNQPRGGTYEQ
jgi:4-hydroxyphenylpyruvate dioxygenase-like putative hemolysin